MRQYLLLGLYLSCTCLSWDRQFSHLVLHAALCFCDPSSWPQSAFGDTCLLFLSPFFQSYNFCILRVGEEGVLETCRYLGPSAPDIPWSHSSLLLPCFSAINNNKKPCTDTPGTQRGSLWMFVDWLTECMQMLSPRLPEELRVLLDSPNHPRILFCSPLSLKLILGWEWREEPEAPSMRPLKNNSRSPRTSCIYTITWGGCQVSPPPLFGYIILIFQGLDETYPLILP